MDPSSALHQEMGINNSLENMLVCSKAQQDRKPRPQPEEALKCPRCDSINTKFCYYNNYSLTQPRYFCKSCRRYWTKGGTLRNVPVGGGCRKNKRSSSSSSKRTQDHQPLMITTNPNPLSNFQHLSYDCNDLSLAFARLQKQSSGQLGFDDHDHLSILGNHGNNHYDILGNPISINTTPPTTHGFLDTLRANFHETPNGNFQNMHYGGFGNDGNNMGEVVETGRGEMMLPFDQGVTTMKQEMCNGGRSEGENNNSRVLWGYPWQHGGEHNGNNMGDHLAPSWHGLLNSPLI